MPTIEARFPAFYPILSPVRDFHKLEKARQTSSMLFSSRPKAADFEAVALPHLNDIYRTASRLMADSTRAEDVVQEVYLQAWKSFHKFEPGTNCRAWLFKILFNTLHHYRRQWFNPRIAKDGEELIEQTAAPSPPVPENITDEDILAALAEIPSDFKAVVLLVDVEEFSYKDVAAIVNVPIGTVMSRLSRGRKLLREQLSEMARSYGIGRATKGGQTA